MDETRVVVMILASALVVTNIAWAIGFSSAVRRIQRLMEKCINHAFAESPNQREMSRLESDQDRAEIFLRESRRKDKAAERRPVVEASPDIVEAIGETTLN